MLHIRRTLTVLLLTLFAAAAWAENDADALYQQAQASYEAQHYQAALDLMEKAVEQEPENSHFQHFLGKCYGRLAEQSNPLSALSLATKTRKAFEKAVQLDGHNVSALRDLMQYYREAPGFLGGSKKKADQIEKQLQDIGISAG